MKKLIALLLLSTACASTPGAAPAPAAGEAQGATLAELQLSMTELLERLDVLNDRIARLEAAQSEVRAAAPAPVEHPAPRRTAPPAAAPSAAAESAPAQQPAAVRSAEIASRYREAITLFAKREYAAARKAFQEVFDSDPQGDLADNALFWIGESYYSAGDFNNALRFYRRVTTEFSDQNKAPDALLKSALSLERTGDLALARTTLQQVIEKYPYSSSAAAAKKELVRIRF